MNQYVIQGQAKMYRIRKKKMKLELQFWLYEVVLGVNDLFCPLLSLNMAGKIKLCLHDTRALQIKQEWWNVFPHNHEKVQVDLLGQCCSLNIGCIQVISKRKASMYTFLELINMSKTNDWKWHEMFWLSVIQSFVSGPSGKSCYYPQHYLQSQGPSPKGSHFMLL